MINSEINEGVLFAGRYRLNRLVGRGSFGEVWHATDERTGVETAVKIYIHLDDAGIKEFCSEFSSVHDLSHTNLLRPDYFDVEGSRPYLIMPYCPASSTELVGSCTPEALRRFIADVAAGLSYLHAAGIVHRDIKPDNILCTAGGRFVITDFGLSRNMRATLRRNSRSVASEQVSGSLSYMSPELFKSSPVHGSEADIWALGVSAFEIATGELPFLGQGGVMQLHGAETPELPDSIPAYLRTIITRCLDADPVRRPKAADIVRMIEQPDLLIEKEEKADKPVKDKSDKTDKKDLKATVKDSDQTSGGAKPPSNTKNNKKAIIIAAAATLTMLLAIGVIALLPSSDHDKELDDLIVEEEYVDPGLNFLQKNARRDSVTTTTSGLQYEIITNGQGGYPTANSEVTVDYEGRFIDGTVFDSGTDATFPVSGVIPGFAEALQLMNLNSSWRIYIPSELAYGEAGIPGVIEPNAVLIFDITLKKIDGASAVPSKIPQDLTLAAKIKDVTYYITPAEWETMSADEKAKYRKLGIAVVRGDHRFIISMEDGHVTTWEDAKKRYGKSLPTYAEAKTIENASISINQLLKLFGGQKLYDDEYWLRDGKIWRFGLGSSRPESNNGPTECCVRIVTRF